MPLYEYQCGRCGRFELIRKFSDPPLEACPTCGGPIQKLFSAPAIQFKGTGWYVTDYARKGAAGGGSSQGDAGKGGETTKSGEASKGGDSPKGGDAGKGAEKSSTSGDGNGGGKDGGSASKPPASKDGARSGGGSTR